MHDSQTKCGDKHVIKKKPQTLIYSAEQIQLLFCEKQDERKSKANTRQILNIIDDWDDRARDHKI